MKNPLALKSSIVTAINKLQQTIDEEQAIHKIDNLELKEVNAKYLRDKLHLKTKNARIELDKVIDKARYCDDVEGLTLRNLENLKATVLIRMGELVPTTGYLEWGILSIRVEVLTELIELKRGGERHA